MLAVFVVGQSVITVPLDYAAKTAALAQRRAELAQQWRAPGADHAAIIREAQEILVDALADELLPAWLGTPWDFNGTTETPKEGVIACGYLVSTVLRDAGFDVQRYRLAQQASERIVQSLIPEGSIRRRRGGSRDEVASLIEAWGEGVYIVGFDYHVGIVLRRRRLTRFCHASYLPPAVVVCANPRTDDAFASSYHVVGQLTNADTLQRWIEKRAFVTKKTTKKPPASP